jgi:hypothetical protein
VVEEVAEVWDMLFSLFSSAGFLAFRWALGFVAFGAAFKELSLVPFFLCS